MGFEKFCDEAHHNASLRFQAILLLTQLLLLKNKFIFIIDHCISSLVANFEMSRARRSRNMTVFVRSLVIQFFQVSVCRPLRPNSNLKWYVLKDKDVLLFTNWMRGPY